MEERKKYLAKFNKCFKFKHNNNVFYYRMGDGAIFKDRALSILVFGLRLNIKKPKIGCVNSKKKNLIITFVNYLNLKKK